MSNSREDSPDWLKAFQAPRHSVLMLSSDSEDSIKDSPLKDDTAAVEKDAELDDEDRKEVSERSKPVNKKTPRKRLEVEGTSSKRRKTTNLNKKTGKVDATKLEEELPENEMEVNRPKSSIWTLSSDSEADTEKEMDEMKLFDDKEDNVPEVDPEVKSSTKKKINVDHTLEDEKKIEEKGDLDDVHEAERAREKHVSSSMLPLIFPEKVQRSKVLVECEGGSIDLSGDVGAVGRVIVSGNPSGDREMLLDLKGTIYRTTIVPSMTFCVVSIGPSEAKIEAMTNDFIQLKPQSNVYDAETMVEGTLNGFSFDSEDEADKGDKNEGGAEEHSNEKTKAKPVRKSAGAQKKGKASGGKQVKKKKPVASKKGAKSKK